ncbi:hypothetical protein MMC29_006389 [Sticta canariensis]|nr:hypothetical protein [Sticta canariensis]
MASFSNFETPLLRVSRPVSACSKCRSAKIKCDGKLPACTACERSGRSAECSSANDQFAKGKERSYVASLESRVERLQKQILQAKGRRSSVRMLDVNSGESTLTPDVHSSIVNRKNERKEASVVDDLVSDFGFLSVNATARDFHGFTKQMSFARLVLSTSSVEEMPKFRVNDFPQRYAITHLIQHYLENIYVLYPFLSETKLFASLDALYQDGGRYANSIDRWTVRLVIAIAFASLSRRRGDAQYRDAVYHTAVALEGVENVLQPGSIVGIQAILLLVVYAMLDPHHFNSWYLIGVASRAMVDLGLHQDSTSPRQVPGPEADLRRRVYHSVYTLDRTISMAHRRAFSFTDDSSNVAFPINQKPFSVSSTSAREQEQVFLHALDPAIRLFQLRQLQSSAYQKLFQSSQQRIKEPWQIMSDSLHEMHLWIAQLPNVIRKPMKKLLRSEVLFGSILILSPPGLSPSLKSYRTDLLFNYACEYADIMSSINGDQEKFAFYTSHDILRASFVARRFLAILRDESGQFLNSTLSLAPPPGSGSVPQPSHLKWTTDEILIKAISCLDRLDKSLEHLSVRYDYPEPWKEFKDDSKVLKEMLFLRRETWN